MIRFVLYLHPQLRELNKGKVLKLIDLFNDRLFPSFQNIDNEADTYKEELLQKILSKSHKDEPDFESIYEHVHEKSIDFYLELSAIKYQFNSASIITLYHHWEHQVKYYLRIGILTGSPIPIKFDDSNFCTEGVKSFKNIFEYYNYNLDEMDCWDGINELRLLNNVLKHGFGSAANKLFSINKNLFSEFCREHDDLAIAMNIDEEPLILTNELFNRYAKSILAFWDEIPEHCYLNYYNT